MPTLVHATLEPNWHNVNGCVLTLYFDGVATREQVREVCDSKGASCKPLPPGLLFGDVPPDFDFEEHPTPVSERAGLRRYEVYP